MQRFCINYFSTEFDETSQPGARTDTNLLILAATAVSILETFSRKHEAHF